MERSKDEHHSSAEFTKEQVTIRSGVYYRAPILPYSTHQLDRTIVLEDHSKVEGDIFGKRVEIGVECEISGYVFAQDWLTVGWRSKVLGDIMSRGSVVLEDETEVKRERSGHIIAGEFRSGRNCVVSGNIIAMHSLEIGEDCSVKGLVCCIGGPVKLGKRTVVRDALCTGPLTIGNGARIMDDVIWSRDSIEVDSIDLDGSRPGENHKRNWHGMEINLNADRMVHGKAQSLKVDEDHLKAVRDILKHRRA